MQSDLNHIQRWQEGDDHAFDVIFRTHYSSLCKSAYHVIQDRHAAEDVVQEFFVSLWKKRDNLTIKSNLQGYLKRAIINRSINYIKSNQKLRKQESIEQTNIQLTGPEQDNLEREDQRKAIKRCVDKLSNKMRKVFILSRYEELTYKEIAELMNISNKTVEVHLRNARLSLRDCLRYLVKENYTFE